MWPFVVEGHVPATLRRLCPCMGTCDVVGQRLDRGWTAVGQRLDAGRTAIGRWANVARGDM